MACVLSEGSSPSVPMILVAIFVLPLFSWKPLLDAGASFLLLFVIVCNQKYDYLKDFWGRYDGTYG